MTLKVTLVSPPTTSSDRYPKGHPLREAIQITEPLGLGYLASMIEDLASVEIVDCIAEDLNIKECVDRVRNSDIVGISAVTSNINIALDVAHFIKEEDPFKLIVFGGIHPSLKPKETLQNINVDLVIIGEGEYSFRKLIEGYPYSKIEGLAYRDEGHVYVNPTLPLERDLDRFPFPARHLLKMDLYKPFLYLRRPIHSLISSRGCPYSCTYCCRDISGQRHRVRSPENVIEEIKLLVDQYKAREVAFQDPIFGLDKKWLKSFCSLLKAENLDVVWSALTRVNLITKESLQWMKGSGCWFLYYGIEAGSQYLLDVMKKKITLEMIEKAVKLTSKSGIKSWGSFMFALPGETPELAQETLDFAKSLPLDFASFHLTTPFLGTELRKNVHKWGVLTNIDEDFTQLKPVFIPYGWEGKGKELEQFYAHAFTEFYKRARYVLRQLWKLRSFAELKMYLRGLKVVK